MTAGEWLAVAIWSLVVILSVACIIRFSHLGPTKVGVARNARVLDAILIVFVTGYAIQMFSRGGLGATIMGALMTVTVTCCVINIFILNRYLDRIERESRL